MIHTHDGYPISPQVIEKNRIRVGYILEDALKMKHEFEPTTIGSVSNLTNLEAIIPSSSETIIQNLNSIYGVFLLEQSEVSIRPVLRTE